MEGDIGEKLEHIKKELQCSICHTYYFKAVTLSCAHSFCYSCIQEWRENHASCPMCRQKVETITPSIILDNMVAIIVNKTEHREQIAKDKSGESINYVINLTNEANDNIFEISDSDSAEEYDGYMDNEDYVENDEYDDDTEDDYGGPSFFDDLDTNVQSCHMNCSEF